MKERLLKRGVVLFLVAVLVVAGVLASHPVTSQAAAKGTTYQVVLQKGSPVVSLVSINGGAPSVSGANNETTTFQMVVEAKAKTEKLKTGPATYYPVTIIAKTFKDPGSHYNTPYGEETMDMAITKTLAKNAIGKLYISGGDVDVKNVQAEKKLTQTIGDGTTDPAGSLIIPIMLFNLNYQVVNRDIIIGKEKVWITTLTTGQSSTLVKGSKSSVAFEGKVLPDDDTSVMLPKPLVGTPINLVDGTGTLVVTECSMNMSVMMIGKTDHLRSFIWKMKITPASK